MANETTWLYKRVAAGAAVLLTGTALVAGSPALQTPAYAFADEALAAEPAANKVQAAVSGTYDQTGAKALLDQINAARETAGIEKLAWSDELEAKAQARAAQVALLGANVSTDPEDIVVSTPETQLATLLDAWVLGAGGTDNHILSNTVEAVGISIFTLDNGTSIAVAEFGAPATDAETTPTLLDGRQTVAVDIALSDLTISVSAEPSTIEAGCTATLAFSTALAKTGAAVTLAQPPQWVSADPSIATVEASTLTGLVAGAADVLLTTVEGLHLGCVQVTVNQPAENQPAESGPASDGNDSTPSPEYGDDAPGADDASDEEPDPETGDDSQKEPGEEDQDRDDMPGEDENSDEDASGAGDADADTGDAADNQPTGSTVPGDITDAPDINTVPNGVPGANSEDPTYSAPDDPAAQGDTPTGDAVIPTVASFTQPATLYVLADTEEPLNVPDELDVVNTDGTPGKIAVKWTFPQDMIPDSKGVLVGTADVAVQESAESEAQIETVKLTVQFVTSIDPVTVEVEQGDALVLPDEVSMSYTDQSARAAADKFTAAVTWDTVPADATDTPGTFTVNGAVDNGGIAVQAEVSVTEAPAEAVFVAALEPVTTTAGTAPVLPSTVEVTWNDDSKTNQDIAWNEIPADAYAEGGTSFDAQGTVAGVEGDLGTITVKVNVVAAEPTIEAVETPKVDTYAGTAPKLPQTVKVTWTDGDETDEAVDWAEMPASSYAQAGTASVSGILTDHPDVTVSCTVRVLPLTVTNVEAPAPVSTEAGVAPALPQTIAVTYSNDSVENLPVTWDTIDSASYYDEGSFTVQGLVASIDAKVGITVNVAAPKVAGVQNNLTVQTTAGTAPVLPATASIKWSNGKVTDEAVAWDAVDASQYAAAGSFKVRGSVVGQSVYCTVNVVAPKATAAPADSVVQTGDTTSIVPVAVGAVAGIAVIAAAIALIVRAKKGPKR